MSILKKTDPAAPKKSEDWDHKPDMLDAVGKIVFSIRWGLVPMYLGLWVAIIAYNFFFMQELFHYMIDTHHGGWVFKPHNETDYLLWILGLIDMSMIGNLVVMTTIGGFSTFVRAFDTSGRFRMPHWLVGLDSNTLKIKMGMSLVGVSAIHLLRTFMAVENSSWDIVLKACLIHVIFMFTTLAFTINARFMPHKAAHGTPPEDLKADPH